MSAGILSAINSSAKALSTYTKAIEVTGNNTANVDTEGYARQKVTIGSAHYYNAGGYVQNTGVEVLAVEQVRDPVLDAQVVKENRTAGKLEAERDLLQLMENTLGDSVGRVTQLSTLDSSVEDNIGSGLVKQTQEFFSAWSEMAASPELSTSQSVVHQRGETLVENYQTVDARLVELESDIDARIASDISNVEALVDEIGQLNAAIGRMEVHNPGSAIELRSQRQKQIEELAHYIDFETQTSEDRNGMIDIVLTTESGSTLELLTGDQRYVDLSSDGTSIYAGKPPKAIKMDGGSLDGALSVRNGELADIRRSLDESAAQMVAAVNAAYNPTGVAGEDFFEAAGTTAGTISLRTGLTAQDIRAHDVGAQGGNAVALAVSDVNDATFSKGTGDEIDGTIRDHLLGVTTSLGESVSSVSAQVEAQETVQLYLEDQRASVSGVNLDEEVTKMMQYQRNYQAASRVLATLDEMLETIVTLV